MNVIAERAVVCVRPDDRHLSVNIVVGQPEARGRFWYSHVEMQGLYKDAVEVRGVDSFQAICLAMGLIRDTLEQHIKDGGKILWSDCSGEIDLATMFS